MTVQISRLDGGIGHDLAICAERFEDADQTDRMPTKRRGDAVARQRRGWAMALCTTVLRPLLMALTKRDWRGVEHIPREGGCVLAVNHVSELDPAPFGHFVYDNGRLPRFLGKAEVFAVPVVGRILRSAGQIPVYRKSTDASKAFGAAVDAVRRGEAVVIYPEGTISRDPGLWPMVGRTGAARIALMTGRPVIPCAQWGPQEILAPYARRPRLLPRKVMHISAGPPVDFGDLADGDLSTEALRSATARIMAAITAQLEQIRGETAPIERFDPRVAGVAEIGNPNDPRNKHVPRPRRQSEGA
jgi:1-acyl-sn-glycerol-3-phosphate acyltransferase